MKKKNYVPIILLFIITFPNVYLNAQQDWELQNSGTTSTLHSIQFINEDIGFTSGVGIILKTVDAGKNWTEVYSGNQLYYSISFIDTLRGWVVGSGYTVLKTTNGGINWSESNPPQALGHLYSVYFVNDTTGFIGSSGGQILKTIDGGIQWDSTNFDAFPSSLFFINETLGWAAGGTNILKTNNGGESWNNQRFSGYWFDAICFVDSTFGWVCGQNGKVLNTTDGGQTWNEQNSNTFENLISVYFTDKNTGWVVGEYGTIIKTIDGGTTWMQEQNVTSNDLYCIYFINSNLGWTCGRNGIIFHYTGSSSGTMSGDVIPLKEKLFQNYPNPFNPSTQINYSISKSEFVTLKVYDVLGNEVAALVNEEKPAGAYTVRFNSHSDEGQNLSSGVYFYRLKAGSYISTKKLILMK
jgi:photosystem II stability/assembly factor-like uncharacterized protein